MGKGYTVRSERAWFEKGNNSHISVLEKKTSDSLDRMTRYIYIYITEKG